jgi:hypothetical protein
MLKGNMPQCACLQDCKPQNLAALAYALIDMKRGFDFGDALHFA